MIGPEDFRSHEAGKPPNCRSSWLTVRLRTTAVVEVVMVVGAGVNGVSTGMRVAGGNPPRDGISSQLF